VKKVFACGGRFYTFGHGKEHRSDSPADHGLDNLKKLSFISMERKE
jgi:hypothetical protein